jgi:AAA15 family ATPase/GTPase
MINRLKLKNFTAFTDITVNFSPKITIIIGENGTGKTHLLKAAYGLSIISSLIINNHNMQNNDIETFLTTKLLRLFLPLDDQIANMKRNTASDDTAYLSVKYSNGHHISTFFSNNSKLISIKDIPKSYPFQTNTVYIPTMEVLSFMKGFNSLYDQYKLSFDQTYKDICLLLDLPEIQPDFLDEKCKWAMEKIESICGGRFIFHGGGKVTFKTEKGEYSNNTQAKGFRKLGMISRLLETGAIRPGVSGPLFWDEPDSNLNPALMGPITQMLLELSRLGQQIILTTHDYHLLKWFDLLLDKSKNDHVLFHSLYNEGNDSGSKVSTTDDYSQISPNPIDKAFANLLNIEIERDMGGLGK